MGFWGWLTGAGAAKEVVTGAGKAVSNVMDRWWPKKMSQKETAEMFLERLDRDIDRDKMTLGDITNARKMFMVEMQTQKQPWIVRSLLGIYRPFAGFVALWVVFYPWFRALLNEWFTWNLPKVELEQIIYLAIIGVATTILVFFFGSAHKGGMSAPDRKPGE